MPKSNHPSCSHIKATETLENLIRKRPAFVLILNSLQMLLFLFLLTCSAPLVLGQRVESNDCSAFSTDGLAASHFQYYRLYDFRNIEQIGTQRKRRRQDLSAPTNRTVSDHTWTEDWYVRNYPRASPGGQSIAVNFVPWRVEIGKSSQCGKDDVADPQLQSMAPGSQIITTRTCDSARRVSTRRTRSQAR